MTSPLPFLGGRCVFRRDLAEVADALPSLFAAVRSASRTPHASWFITTTASGITKRADDSEAALRRLDGRVRAGACKFIDIDDQPRTQAHDRFDGRVWCGVTLEQNYYRRPAQGVAPMSVTLLADLRVARSAQAVVDATLAAARAVGAPYAFLHADGHPQDALSELDAEPVLPFRPDSPPTAEERAANERWRYIERLADRWLSAVPDVYWGMWLGPAFAEAVGGLSALLALPAHAVVGQEDGSVYLQLTADPANVRRPEYAEQVAAWRRVLAPVLLPPYQGSDSAAAA